MRIRAAVVAIVTLVVGLIAALISTPATAGPAVGPAVGQPAATRKAEEKIKPELRAQLTARSVAPVAFWVRFGERPDLSEAATIDDWKARGTAVHPQGVRPSEPRPAGLFQTDGRTPWGWTTAVPAQPCPRGLRW